MKRIHVAMTVHAVALAGFGALALLTLHNQSEARKCKARAEASAKAGQAFYAEAWRWEEGRARQGHGCRDNITAAGVISED